MYKLVRFVFASFLIANVFTVAASAAQVSIVGETFGTADHSVKLTDMEDKAKQTLDQWFPYWIHGQSDLLFVITINVEKAGFSLQIYLGKHQLSGESKKNEWVGDLIEKYIPPIRVKARPANKYLWETVLANSLDKLISRYENDIKSALREIPLVARIDMTPPKILPARDQPVQNVQAFLHLSLTKDREVSVADQTFVLIVPAADTQPLRLVAVGAGLTKEEGLSDLYSVRANVTAFNRRGGNYCDLVLFKELNQNPALVEIAKTGSKSFVWCAGPTVPLASESKR